MDRSMRLLKACFFLAFLFDIGSPTPKSNGESGLSSAEENMPEHSGLFDHPRIDNDIDLFAGKGSSEGSELNNTEIRINEAQSSGGSKSFGSFEENPEDLKRSKRLLKVRLTDHLWRKRHLSYCLTNYMESVGSREEFEELIQKALDLWGKYGLLHFNKVSSKERADFVITFTGEKHGDLYPFKSVNETKLAHAFFPAVNSEGTNTLPGDVHLFNKHKWAIKIPKRGQVSFFITLVHEIGHSLGFGHNFDTNIPSIMWPYLSDMEGLNLTDKQSMFLTYGLMQMGEDLDFNHIDFYRRQIAYKLQEEARILRQSEVKLDSSKIPELCETGFDATVKTDNELYIFSGKYYWKFTYAGMDKWELHEKFPRKTKNLFTKLEADSTLDSAVYDPVKDRIIAFVGDSYYTNHDEGPFDIKDFLFYFRDRVEFTFRIENLLYYKLRGDSKVLYDSLKEGENKTEHSNEEFTSKINSADYVIKIFGHQTGDAFYSDGVVYFVSKEQYPKWSTYNLGTGRLGYDKARPSWMGCPDRPLPTTTKAPPKTTTYRVITTTRFNNPCTEGEIEAATIIRQNELFIFKGEMMWLYEFIDGHWKLYMNAFEINRLLRGWKFDHIDAVYESGNGVAVILGRSYYHYNFGTDRVSGPFPLSDKFNLPRDVKKVDYALLLDEKPVLVAGNRVFTQKGERTRFPRGVLRYNFSAGFVDRDGTIVLIGGSGGSNQLVLPYRNAKKYNFDFKC